MLDHIFQIQLFAQKHRAGVGIKPCLCHCLKKCLVTYLGIVTIDRIPRHESDSAVSERTEMLDKQRHTLAVVHIHDVEPRLFEHGVSVAQYNVGPGSYVTVYQAGGLREIGDNEYAVKIHVADLRQSARVGFVLVDGAQQDAFRGKLRDESVFDSVKKRGTVKAHLGHRAHEIQQADAFRFHRFLFCYAGHERAFAWGTNNQAFVFQNLQRLSQRDSGGLEGLCDFILWRQLAVVVAEPSRFRQYVAAQVVGNLAEDRFWIVSIYINLLHYQFTFYISTGTPGG